jgi:hypothetical protein
MKTLKLPAALALVGAVACSDSNGRGNVSLSLSSQKPLAPLGAAPVGALAGAPSVVMAGDSTIIVLGNDSVLLGSLDVVLREIELKHLEAAACDAVEGNGDCEEFETGPVLASFPLGAASTAATVSVNAPAGQYDELEFDIHKTDPTGDAAFIALNPGFSGISIRVTGSYSKAGTRSTFTFTSDLDASQEIAFAQPLTVTDGVAANLTIRLDVSSWFVDAGSLVDPNSANKGGPNESIVQNNIKNSVDAFEDDNHDGHDDHSEGH